MFFTFRTHLIHRPFASNATSCTTQQLLLRYQITQYDRYHFPVTGILLISVCEAGFGHNWTSCYECGNNTYKPTLQDVPCTECTENSVSVNTGSTNEEDCGMLTF